MKPAAFDYIAAHSLEEALAALQEGGEDAKPIAGGQSLVPALNMRLVRPTLLVDLNRAGLDAIEANGVVRIGATVRQAALEHDPRTHPLLREALPHVGHFVTRNRGTVGGSVAHADGAAEIPLCLAALGGTVVVEGPSGRREIAPADFFVTHYLTTLAPGELVVATTWPVPAPDEGVAFEELSLRAGDYGLAMVAVALRRVEGVARDVRVWVGAVTDRPTALAERRARGRRGLADGGVGARGRPARRCGRRPAGLDPRLRRVPSPPHRHARRAGAAAGLGAGRVTRDLGHGQRQGRRRRRRAAPAPDRLPPPPPRAHRHARRLRARRLRRLHRAARRRLGPRLLPARGPGRRLGGGDGRVARRRRDALAAPGRLQAPPRAPVRLLHPGHPDRRRRPALPRPAVARGDRRHALGPPLPLHRLRADRRRDRGRS